MCFFFFLGSMESVNAEEKETSDSLNAAKCRCPHLSWGYFIVFMGKSACDCFGMSVRAELCAAWLDQWVLENLIIFWSQCMEINSLTASVVCVIGLLH
ncbi:hypothetical protein EUGRSUZ_F02885 [Eucalyptus grandis]|uniref:Uncharacterized protein n=2 Tax=Eucalyptus grandis TaxID=71139 RepID=A0ACC3KJ79_EUCGR|nr:hypothetical protein EUGRSUZ_F02885 [Eucalyptus grandis]